MFEVKSGSPKVMSTRASQMPRFPGLHGSKTKVINDVTYQLIYYYYSQKNIKSQGPRLISHTLKGHWYKRFTPTVPAQGFV